MTAESKSTYELTESDGIRVGQRVTIQRSGETAVVQQICCYPPSQAIFVVLTDNDSEVAELSRSEIRP